MTTEAKIRNYIHIYLGAVLPYKLLTYTIIDFDEVGQFLIKMVGCALLSIFLGGFIELFQSMVLSQKYDFKDVERTALGGVVGGLICVADQHFKFMDWLFYASLVIILAELVRIVIVKVKK